MNLVKWFRKNNKKVMAVVVIVILFGFIGGGTFLQYLSRRATGLHSVVAHFADNREVTRYDLTMAQEQLRILRMADADALLRNIGVPLFKTADLHPLLLGELLLSEQRTSPTFVNQIQQMIRTNDYRISESQINDIYRRSMPGEIYWYCLTNEAKFAGVRISNENTGKLLARAIPQIPDFRGATYSQLIGSVVKHSGIPEEKILTTFGELLSILEYAKMSCSSEDITSSQIMHRVSRERETIDVNFVKFDSSVFAETQSEPNQERIVEHFNRYKKFFAGVVSEENPYGFGYKLADRVQLEYIACRLDDISKIVTPPTHEEAEEYYQKNRAQFTEEVASDPNDPNSPLTERIKSYAEVAAIISKGLLQNKINSKAKSVLNEAKELTEADLQDIDTASDDLSAEELKQRVGDYETAAEELIKKYKVTLYTGQTGQLGAADMMADEYLGRLYLSGYGGSFVGLTQIVFAIDELGLSELGPHDMSKPRMYGNIGPVRDILGRIMAVVRVIEAEKASEPESINQSFSTRTLDFETGDEQANEAEPNRVPSPDLENQDVFSVQEKATEDLKRLAAMETTRKCAEEFIELAVKNGWESTLQKFNELYGRQEEEDSNEANVSADPNAINVPDETFNLVNSTNLQRISRETIARLSVQSEDEPGARLFVTEAQKWLLVNEAQIERRFIDSLYSLVPQDSNTVDTVPVIMEFKPDMSYYCVKEIFVKRVHQGEYEQSKPLKVYTQEHIQSQSLAAVHFNPENILKRMNFRWVREEEQAADSNQPPESEEAS
ncbi:MAG TPA: hypothetical protein HPP66_06270 [Planctomycetes bacterium]|nr:hypothetical protein [Planctomycetota bacterium]